MLTIQIPIKVSGELDLELSDRSTRQIENSICHDNPEVMETAEYNGYQIRVSEAGEHSCALLDIERDGKTLYHYSGVGEHIYLGTGDEEKDSRFLNLNPKGDPHLIVRKWTGGMHCCYSLHIFELSDELKIVNHIEGGNFEPQFVDLDQDGIPEIEITDDFLAYVFSSFAFSATASVILKYSNGHYRVAADLMKKPSPNLNSFKVDIELWQEELRKHDNADWPPPPMIQAMTNLIFNGNKDTAIDLLDLVWPPDIPGKSEFLNSYEKTLRESRYYTDFEMQL